MKRDKTPTPVPSPAELRDSLMQWLLDTTSQLDCVARNLNSEGPLREALGKESAEILAYEIHEATDKIISGVRDTGPTTIPAFLEQLKGGRT